MTERAPLEPLNLNALRKRHDPDVHDLLAHIEAQQRRIAELEENARSNPDGVDGMRRTIEALGRVNAEQQRRIEELESEHLLDTWRAEVEEQRIKIDVQESEIDRQRQAIRELGGCEVCFEVVAPSVERWSSAKGLTGHRSCVEKAALSERPK